MQKIQDLKLNPLDEIRDERGSVLHLLRSDDPGYLGFNECYCSEVLPGAVKAWKRHRIQTQNLAVPVGRLRLVIYDERPSSATFGELVLLDIGRPDNYVRITIPPGLWYGFGALGHQPAIIVNCVDYLHDPTECDRLPEDAVRIPYRWMAKDLAGK